MSGEWLSPAQLRDMLGIKESTQAKYRHEKKIPYTKIGGFVFYSKAKIEAWLNAHAVQID